MRSVVQILSILFIAFPVFGQEKPSPRMDSLIRELDKYDERYRTDFNSDDSIQLKHINSKISYLKESDNLIDSMIFQVKLEETPYVLADTLCKFIVKNGSNKEYLKLLENILYFKHPFLGSADPSYIFFEAMKSSGKFYEIQHTILFSDYLERFENLVLEHEYPHYWNQPEWNISYYTQVLIRPLVLDKNLTLSYNLIEDIIENCDSEKKKKILEYVIGKRK